MQLRYALRRWRIRSTKLNAVTPAAGTVARRAAHAVLAGEKYSQIDPGALLQLRFDLLDRVCPAQSDPVRIELD